MPSISRITVTSRRYSVAAGWCIACLTVLCAIGPGCATPAPRANIVYFPKSASKARVIHLQSFNGLRDLVPRKPGFLELLRGGAAHPQVGRPAGLAYRDGHLYICDTQDNVVHDWNLSNGEARRIGRTGGLTLMEPVAVAVDDRGTVFVADTGRGEVVAYIRDNDAGTGLRKTDCHGLSNARSGSGNYGYLIL